MVHSFLPGDRIVYDAGDGSKSDIGVVTDKTTPTAVWAIYESNGAHQYVSGSGLRWLSLLSREVNPYDLDLIP